MIDYLINLFNSNPIGQTLGLIALMIQGLGIIKKNDKKFLTFQIFSYGAWIIHFFFMGIIVGAVMSIISMIRSISAIKFFKNTKVYLFFFGISLISGAIFFENYTSILAIAGSLTGLTTYFFLTGSGIKFRLGFLLALILWLSYHFLNGSIGGTINGIIMIILNISTIYRLYLEKKKQGSIQ